MQITNNLTYHFKHKLNFDEALAQSLARKFNVEEFKKHTILLREGELWNKIFFIEQGLLRLYYSTGNGKEFNKGFFAENNLIWPIAPSARDSDSLFNISCIEKTQVLWMPFSEFQSLLKQHNCWSSFALPYAEKLADQKFLREHQFLVNDAKNRYLYVMEELGDIFQRLPDYHVASYMGITPVALSRIKAQIKL